jgi:hypothetical protein
MKKLLGNIFKYIFRAHWVNCSNELGLKIMGITLLYYKDSDPIVMRTGLSKPVTDKEFGHSVHPIKEQTHEVRQIHHSVDISHNVG